MISLTKLSVIGLTLFLSACTTSHAVVAGDKHGVASWYGSEVCKGRKKCQTANGEHFNPNGLTAAHRSLRFGTKVRVTNPRNGKSVVVRINDRGPFIRSRVLDISKGAARTIGMNGTSKIKYKVL